ncbi:MAG: hypothetical protein JXX14_19850 [Deltaproteobacteria bacterium]|nr:hypothetical protein [Deltaproteobacteria bacterium]
MRIGCTILLLAAIMLARGNSAGAADNSLAQTANSGQPVASPTRFNESKAFRLSFFPTVLGAALGGTAYGFSLAHWEKWGMAAPIISYSALAVSLGIGPAAGYLYLRDYRHAAGLVLLRTAILLAPLAFSLGVYRNSSGGNCAAGSAACDSNEARGVTALRMSGFFALLIGAAIATWDVATVKKMARALNKQQRIDVSVSITPMAAPANEQQIQGVMGWVHGRF